eukprot:3801756-Prymnesium_polylepis.1
MPFNGRSIEQWLQSELGQNMSADVYGQRQSRGGWGGAIEILAFMLSKHVNIWVWVLSGRDGRGQQRFRRTTCYQVQQQCSVGRVDLCRSHGVHYDLFVPDKKEVISQMKI